MEIIQIKDKIKTLIDTGFVHIFGFTVINKILNFLSSVIVVRIISKEAFGTYTYANNILSMILLFSGIGLVSGTFQLCSEQSGKNRRIENIYAYGSNVAIKFNLVLAVGIIIIALVVPFKIEGAGKLILLMALQPVFIIIFELQQIYLRSNLENKKYAYSCNINTILMLVLSVIGSIIWEAKGLIVGTYLAYIISEIIIYVKFGAPISLHKGKLQAAYRKLLYKISLISMCNNGLAQLLYLADIFILGLIIADENVIAAYKVATVIPTAMSFVPSAVVTYIYPYFAMHRQDGIWTRKHYKLLLRYMSVMNLIITLVLVIFTKPIISIVYGTQYLDAITCFRILAISYFFSGTFRIISGNLLVTQRKLGINLLVSIISGLVNIIGNIILIPLFESNGAALTTTIVVLISSIISTWYYTHTIKNI